MHEFRGFRLDPDRRLLFGPHGQAIPLKPKILDTLVHLVTHAGELLDKRNLMEAVWGDVVVEENSLNQHISALRRVFGEMPGENRFIVTVPGRGYRFVAEVRTPPEPSAESERASKQPSLARAAGSRSAAPAATGRTGRHVPIAVLLFIVCALLAWSVRLANVGPLPYSIAVLPFADLSPDSGDASVAAAFHEEIIGSLNKFTDFKVIARTSTLRYSDGSKSIPEIARDLDVETVLEGTIRFTDDTVRVTARLIDAATGVSLWQEVYYDEEVSDIFAIESDIAVSVASALKGQLSAAERERIFVEETSIDILGLYAQATHVVEHQSVEVRGQLPEMRARLERAIVEDPDYYPIRLVLSNTYFALWQTASEPDRIELGRLMHKTAEEALTMWPDRPEALAVHGSASAFVYGDLEMGAREVERALHLEPNNITALRTAADIAEMLGRIEAAVQIQEHVLRRDPLCTRCRQTLMGLYLEFDRYDSAIEIYETANALDLELGPLGLIWYKLALAMSGRADAAMSLMFPVNDRPFPVDLIVSVVALYHGGRTAAFEERLSDLLEHPWFIENPWALAVVYVWLDDVDSAVDILAALPSIPPNLFDAEVLVRSRLRAHARWPELAEKAGIPADDPRDRISFIVDLPDN